MRPPALGPHDTRNKGWVMAMDNGGVSRLGLMAIGLALSVAGAGLGLASGNSGPDPGGTVAGQDSLKAGDDAPSFVMDDLATGQPVFLSDYAGRTLRQPWKNSPRHVLVLCFWTSLSTPCKQEIEELSRFAAAFSDRPVAFFLVNTRERAGMTTEQIRSVVSERGYALTVLLDATGTVADRYGVHTLPATFVIDKMGVLKSLHQGTGSTLDGSLEKLVRSLAEESEPN